MSSLYNLEPLPTAKLLLHTTSGSLTLSLFAKQTPLASRNFLQHCLDGYYNNTIFHRLVPNFILQGGDPTGTGSGGLSSYENGAPFEDEFHSRLKFNRRGLLGMANDRKDGNESQFFLTLGETPELQGKHTLFGRVEGDTIFNLVKMGEGEMQEGSERPLYPVRITGAEILVNPFEDMVARVVKGGVGSGEGRGNVEKKKRKKPAGKNVLSFADEEGEGDAPVLKKVKANPTLVDTLGKEGDLVQKPKAVKPRKIERIIDENDESDEEPTKVELPARVPPPSNPHSEDETEQPLPDFQNKSKLEQTNAEIAALKASMKRQVNAAPSSQKEPPKSLLKSMIPSSSTRGRKRGKASDEKGALDLFKAFKQRLDGIPDDGEEDEAEQEVSNAKKTNGESIGRTADVADDEEAPLCDLHFIANCQSCKSWDDEDQTGEGGEADREEDEDGAWMAHRLTFAKDTLGKDLEWKKKMEEIEVIDPREKARAIEEERRKGKGKKEGRGKR